MADSICISLAVVLGSLVTANSLFSAHLQIEMIKVLTGGDFYICILRYSCQYRTNGADV